MAILVIDVGGTHIKPKLQGVEETRKCPSGLELTPQKMIDLVRAATADWKP